MSIMGKGTSVTLEEEKPSLRRTQSQPASEKPEFEVEIDLRKFRKFRKFSGKVTTCLSKAMEAEQRRQARQEKIKSLPQAMSVARSNRSSALYEEEPTLTEQEVEKATAEVAIARMDTETAHAKRRDLILTPSVVSISTMESTIIVGLSGGAADSILPNIGVQIHPPRSSSATQSNNQERQGGRWTPINAPTGSRAMRDCLVSEDGTYYNSTAPCNGNGYLIPAEASQPPADRAAATAEMPKLELRISARRAQTERVRARGVDLASMAGATAFDHTGALAVFTSLSRESRKKRARQWTIHENCHIDLLEKYRWDITKEKAGDGEGGKSEVETSVRKSEGHRTIYSYFQPIFRHQGGVLAESVRFEMINGLLHIDGVKIGNLPGFEFGMGYSNEQTSQRMIQERERTAIQVARPVRNRLASQFGQLALQVSEHARERHRDLRNRIPGRFYCEEEGCGQSYNLEGNLLFHQRIRHGPVETHSCDECPKSFRRENQLERHQRIHERQRAEALREAILGNESAQPQDTSEGAVPGTAQCAAKTLRELPFWQSNIETAQPQDAGFDDTAVEEHTGTTPAGEGPPDTDDENNNVGLRGGLLEVPRPLCRRTIFLVQMLKYTSLPTFDLSRHFKQWYCRWRSIPTEVSLRNYTSEDEKWKAFWPEQREGLPRGTETPSDLVTDLEVSAAIEKLRELDFGEPQLETCLLGFYDARKDTFRAADGHIFEFLSTWDPVSIGHARTPSIGTFSFGLDDDTENVGLRGGADESSPTLDFAPETPSISYLVQMLKNPYGSDAHRTLHQRKIDELRYLNSVILSHNPNEDDARWKLFWIYWKDNWRETFSSLPNSWVLTTNEVVIATIAWLKKLKLEERELDSCIYGLHAATAITFLLVMGRLYDIASNPARANYSLPDGPVRYALNGAANGAPRNVGLRGGADDAPSTSETTSMNLARNTTSSDLRETFLTIESELVYFTAFKMAEGFVPNEPHSDDRHPVWNDCWDVYWHSIPGEIERTIFRPAEVDATLHEMEKQEPVEPDLFTSLARLKMARDKTLWKVQVPMENAVLARKKVGDDKGSAVQINGPVTDKISGGEMLFGRPSSDYGFEGMGLRGGESETPMSSVNTHTIRNTYIHEHDPSFPPFGQESVYISAFESLQAGRNACFPERKWKAFWDDWTGDDLEVIERLRAAAAILELKRLHLSEPQLSACLFGLLASKRVTFWAVYACIDQVVADRTKDKENVVALRQKVTNSAALIHSKNYDIEAGDFKGSEGERTSISAILHVIGDTFVPEAVSDFPPIGEEFIYLAALQTAKSHGYCRFSCRLGDREWKESWTIFGHSVSEAKESQQDEVAAIIQELNRLRLVGPELSSCLFGLKWARQEAFWSVHEFILNIIVARSGMSSGRAAAQLSVSITDGVLEGGASIETAQSDHDAGTMGPRGGGDEKPKTSDTMEVESEGEAQDEPQTAGHVASREVDGDNLLTQSMSSTDHNRHTCNCAPQCRRNSDDTRRERHGQLMLHSGNQDVSPLQQSPYMTAEVLGEGVSIDKPYKLTTLLQRPKSSDFSSTEAPEEEAPARIQAIVLLKVLDDLNGVRSDQKAFGKSLHPFITKFGLASNEVGFRLKKADQKHLSVLLELNKDVVPTEAHKRLNDAVKSGKKKKAEEAEARAKILNLNKKLKLKLEGVSRKRHGFAKVDSGLHGHPGDPAVPVEENTPSEGRTIVLLQTLDSLNGLRRGIRASAESVDAFIAKFGMIRTRVRAGLDRRDKEILYMLLSLIREELLTKAQETIGRIFETTNYGKTQTPEDVEACAKILSLTRQARTDSEGLGRTRYVGTSKESGLRGGADIYDPRLDLHTGAALLLRRQNDYTHSRQSLHNPASIDERALGICCTLKGNEAIMNPGYRHVDLILTDCKAPELRGGDIPGSETMQCLAKEVEQYTVDGSNVIMSGRNECQYRSGNNFCSTHQMHHDNNISMFRSDSLHLPTVGLCLRKEISTASPQHQEVTPTDIIKHDNNTCVVNSHDRTYWTSHGRYHNGHVAQPLPYSPHAQHANGISADRALFFGRPINQPRDPSMAWRPNIYSATNGAVGLIDQTDICYYPDPVNSQFCTSHHIIHGRLRSPQPPSYNAPYALDETTLMAQARALTLGSPYAPNESTIMAHARAVTLGSPYALDETTLRAQARALALGFVKNGVPDIAMLQHQAKVHASQVFGHNPQWTHEMQPSARSHLWAAQGGAYFGRGLQQTLASSRVVSWSPNAAQSVGSERRETSFTTSISKMNDRTLAPSCDAENRELESSYCNKPAAMPPNTRKRQRTLDFEEEEEYRADALGPNQNARKRTKKETSPGIEQSQQPSTFVDTSALFANQHDDCEMVDAPLSFNHIFENERGLTVGRADARDLSKRISFDGGSRGLRGGQLDNNTLDAHTNNSSNLPLRTAQQSTRQFTSCIRQVESGHSRIPVPVSPTDPLRQNPSSAPHVATNGLDGTNDANHNPFVERPRTESEGMQLNTDGFNVSFEVPPLTPDYPSARRNATRPAAALYSTDEVLSTRQGREIVMRSRDGQPLSILGRRQRSTSSSASPLSRPAPASRNDSFASVASAQITRHTLTPSARTRTFVAPQQIVANPIRQPFNPPSHALLDHPFIRTANSAVQFQVPFQNPNPLRPPLQLRELSSPQVYPVLTPRPSTPPPLQRIAWNDEEIFRGFLSDMEGPNVGGRARVSRRVREVQRAVTPPLRRRVPWDDEADSGGSLSDLQNPEEFARRSRRLHRRREALRRERVRQGAEVPLFNDLSHLPRPEMSGGLVLIEDDIWERNQRLAREAEGAPLYLRSFVDALPTGMIGGVYGDRQAYIDSLMRSTAASRHGAGQRGGVPEGVWYIISFQRRLDSKPAPKRKRLNTRSNNHRHVLNSENDFSGAESDEDEEYLVFSWDVQIPAAGMKDLLRSTGTEWGVKAVRARDWALEEMAIDSKSDGCMQAIGEWWEAVRGGASRDERCKGVGVRVLEP